MYQLNIYHIAWQHLCSVGVCCCLYTVSEDSTSCVSHIIKQSFSCVSSFRFLAHLSTCDSWSW